MRRTLPHAALHYTHTSCYRVCPAASSSRLATWFTHTHTHISSKPGTLQFALVTMQSRMQFYAIVSGVSFYRPARITTAAWTTTTTTTPSPSMGWLFLYRLICEQQQSRAGKIDGGNCVASCAALRITLAQNVTVIHLTVTAMWLRLCLRIWFSFLCIVLYGWGAAI